MAKEAPTEDAQGGRALSRIDFGRKADVPMQVALAGAPGGDPFSRIERTRKVDVADSEECIVPPFLKHLVPNTAVNGVAPEEVSASSLPRVNITIATVIYNEGFYLNEWIAYHSLRGVGRFILYDNNSSDNPSSVVHSMVIQGLVIVHDVPLCARPSEVDYTNNEHGFWQQRHSVMHALRTYGPSTEWMIFTDVDEFLHSPAHDSLLEPLVTFHSKHLRSGQRIMTKWLAQFTEGKSILEDTWWEYKQPLNVDSLNCKVALNIQQATVDKVAWKETNIHRFGLPDARERGQRLSPAVIAGTVNPDLVIYHAWWRGTIEARRDRPHHNKKIEQYLNKRLSLARLVGTAELADPPNLRWVYGARKQIDTRFRVGVTDLLLFGRDHIGTNAMLIAMAEDALTIYEPCQTFFNSGSTSSDAVDPFQNASHHMCISLLFDIFQCRITSLQFDRLRSNQNYFLHRGIGVFTNVSGAASAWNSYRQWMESCWTRPVVVGETRGLPLNFISNVPFVHVTQNPLDALLSYSEQRSEVRDGPTKNQILLCKEQPKLWQSLYNRTMHYVDRNVQVQSIVDLRTTVGLKTSKENLLRISGWISQFEHDALVPHLILLKIGNTTSRRTMNWLCGACPDARKLFATECSNIEIGKEVA